MLAVETLTRVARSQEGMFAGYICDNCIILPNSEGSKNSVPS